MLSNYLNKGIKEVISEFPEIGHILEDYVIGCVPCTVGTCLLKDIVSIHYLGEDQEKELMSRISAVLENKSDPGPATKCIKDSEPVKSFQYSAPIQELVDEHTLIKRRLALIPKVADTLDLESHKGKEIVLTGIDLIRSYADRFHHSKEEDILFQYFDQDQEIEISGHVR